MIRTSAKRKNQSSAGGKISKQSVGGRIGNARCLAANLALLTCPADWQLQ
jgi:hypothetical protein